MTNSSKSFFPMGPWSWWMSSVGTDDSEKPQSLWQRNVNKWVEAQKKLLDQWRDSVSSEESPSGEWIFPLFYPHLSGEPPKAWKSFSDAFWNPESWKNRDFSKFFQIPFSSDNPWKWEYPMNLQKFWKDMGNSFLDSERINSFDAFLEAYPALYPLYRFWKSLYEDGVSDYDALNEFFVQKYSDAYRAMAASLLSPSFFQGFSMMEGLAKNFRVPGMPTADFPKELTKMWTEGITKGNERMDEFYDRWKAGWEESCRALEAFPATQAMAQFCRGQGKIGDALKGLSDASRAFFAKATAVSRESQSEFIARCETALKNSSAPMSFSEFYSYCTEGMSSNLNSLTELEEYADLVAEYVRVFEEVREHNAAMSNLAFDAMDGLVENPFEKIARLERDVEELRALVEQKDATAK
jgi:hypothetical protein